MMFLCFVQREDGGNGQQETQENKLQGDKASGQQGGGGNEQQQTRGSGRQGGGGNVPHGPEMNRQQGAANGQQGARENKQQGTAENRQQEAQPNGQQLPGNSEGPSSAHSSEPVSNEINFLLLSTINHQCIVCKGKLSGYTLWI